MLKKTKLNEDGTKDIHEIVDNGEGKIENMKKVNAQNEEIQC